MSLLESIRINGQPLSAALVAADLEETQPVEIACAPQPDVSDARLTIGDGELGPPATTLGDPTWRWRWHPQQAIGVFGATLRLRSRDGLTRDQQFELRIVPRKIDIDQYEALIGAVQRDACAIVYALGGGRAGAAIGPSGDRSLIEEYVLLVERLAGAARIVAERIAARPHTTLHSRRIDAPLGAIERIDGPALAEIGQQPLDEIADDVLPSLQQALRPDDQTSGGPLPRALPAADSAASVDCVENRALRHVLDVLAWRTGYVRDLLRRERDRRQRNARLIDSPGTQPINAWFDRCAVAARGLRRALALPLFADLRPYDPQRDRIGAPTHLMRHDPRYRRLYALIRELRSAPFIAFDSPTLWLPIEELPALYEQWCALRSVRAALALGEALEQTLVERADDDAPDREPRWSLRLRQNRPMLVLRVPGGHLRVCYQRRYRPHAADSATLGALDPFVRIPDVAIEIIAPDRAPRVLVLDAKYRVMPDGRIPQDALDDAYAYRSAIGVGGARATIGAYALFPGSVVVETAERVGALPLLPDRAAALDELLATAAATIAPPA